MNIHFPKGKYRTLKLYEDLTTYFLKKLTPNSGYIADTGSY